MRLATLYLSFALGASALAQTPGASSAVVLQAPTSRGCPVSLEARHANDRGATINVSPSVKHVGQAYRIRLYSLAPGHGHTISQVRITLHGLAGGHVMPAGEAPNGEATESFNVAAGFGDRGRFQTTVYTGKLTGVQWVELNEITYADGEVWHESADASCRVAPNGYMLVASGK